MQFPLLVLLLIATPIAEIVVLLEVGDLFGVPITIVFVLFTAFLGAYLVRQQGLATFFKLQSELQSGGLPAMRLAEGVALLVAGALLLTPGFITDAVGFVLLTPVLRQVIIRRILHSTTIYAQGSSAEGYGATSERKSSTDAIEGDYKELD